MKYLFIIRKTLYRVFKEYSRIIMATTGIIIFLIFSNVLLNNSKIDTVNPFKLQRSDVSKLDDDILLMDGNDKAKVYIESKKKVCEINVEEYVTGVVASEMPITFNEQALKAQAVAARTYYYSKRIENCVEAHGGEICDSVHCQVYMTKEERMKKWPKDKADDYWTKALEAVNSTKDEVLTYDNELVMHPQFFAVSSGKTENSEDVFSDDIPYLKSTSSSGEEIAPKYHTEVKHSVNDFINKINNSYSDAKLVNKNLNDNIKILSRTEGGSVKEIKLGNIVISGAKFRKLFDIASANFEINIQNNNVKIDCTGYGHGVGMSQWGARAMADNGSDYKEILKHYYSGVQIKKIQYK